MSLEAVIAVTVSVLVPVLTLATVYGGQKVLMRVLDEKAKGVDATLQRFGERLGNAEGDIKALRAVRRVTESRLKALPQDDDNE